MTTAHYTSNTTKSQYVPFVYILIFTITGQLYIGARYGKGAHPTTLWTKYFTSSKVVKALIAEHGKEAFEIFEIFECETKEEALELEERMLVQNTAGQSDKFLNLHNGGKNFCNTEESDKAAGKALKALYAEHPELGEAMSATKKAYNAAHPEAGKAHSEKMKAHFAKPGAREAAGEGHKAHYAKPGAREAQGGAQKARFAKPGAREAHSEGQKARWDKPGAREAQSEIKKAHYAKPGAREAASEIKKAHYAKPGAREAYSEVMIALQGKTYKITFPDESVQIIKGIKAFCRDHEKHGLSPSAMIKVAKGRATHHKKFKCEYYDPEQTELI